MDQIRYRYLTYWWLHWAEKCARARKLVEAGFDYVCDQDDLKFFRKQK